MKAIKTEGTLSNFANFYTIGVDEFGSMPNLMLRSGSIVGFTDTKVGKSNPGWQDAISKSLNVTSPYSRVVKKRTPIFIIGLGQWKGNGKRWNAVQETGSTNFSLPISDPSSLDASSLISEATIAAAAKCKQQGRGNFDGLSFLGEIRDTVRELRHPAKQIRDLTTSFYNGKWTRMKSRGRVKAVSDAFLEWRFGISPLIHDIEGIISSTDELYKKKVRTRDRGGSKMGSSSIEPIVRTYTADYFSYRYQIKSDIEVKVTVGGGREIVLKSLGDMLSYYYGINFSSVIPALYEITPYSFVLDYFSNLQDLVDLGFSASQKYDYTYTTTKVVKSRSLISLGLNNLFIAGYSTKPLSGAIQTEWEEMTFTRTLSGPSDANLKLHLSLPSFGQLVNLAALLGAYSKSGARTW